MTEIDLPKSNTTPNKIYAWHESLHVGNGWRAHLGASLIGAPCKRSLWFTFRWAKIKSFSGRLLRLFKRGQAEEHIYAHELRAIGCEVITHDPSTGEQYLFSDVDGHFGGSMDGAARRVPESPQTWHVLEFKTHNNKSFTDLVKNKVQKSKPMHYAQMIMYMAWSGMTRALYLATNKDTDEIYVERIHANKKEAEALREKARQVIYAPEPLEKISNDPSWYECKFCDYYGLCHKGEVAAVNCRTCLHSTPIADGKWNCKVHGNLTEETQRSACGDHLFIPALIPYAKPISACEESIPTYVKYRRDDNVEFSNITDKRERCEGHYLSEELAHIPGVALCDPNIDKVRVEMGAK